MSKELFPDLTVHHVAYSVRDLEEAVNFWTELFGFERDFDKQIPPIKAKLAFLKRDGFWLELFEVEDSKSPTKTQLKPNTDLAQQGTKHLCFSWVFLLSRVVLETFICFLSNAFSSFRQLS